MIHCKACGKATWGLDGYCPRCYRERKLCPDTDAFVLAYIEGKDREMEMAFVQKQVDDMARRQEEVLGELRNAPIGGWPR